MRVDKGGCCGDILFLKKLNVKMLILLPWFKEGRWGICGIYTSQYPNSFQHGNVVAGGVWGEGLTCVGVGVGRGGGVGYEFGIWFWLFVRMKMRSSCIGYESMINCGYCGMRFGLCWVKRNANGGILGCWVGGVVVVRQYLEHGN